VRKKQQACGRFHPRLEQLEARTLLDGAAARLSWLNPAVLAGQAPAGVVGPFLPPPGPPPGPPPSPLVNDPGEDTNANDTQSETSIVVANNGNIVAAYNDSGSNRINGSKFTGWSVSTDGGATFTDEGVLPTNPSGDAGDPSLAVDTTSGRIYLVTLGFVNGNAEPVFRSDDNGLTFQAPVTGTPGGSSEDKEWITVDNSAGPGQGTVYLISRRFGAGPGIYLFRSTDAGNSFGPTGGVAITTDASCQGAYVTVGPDHTVYAFWFQNGSIRMRKSTDHGATFGPEVQVTTLRTTGVNGDLGLTGVRVGTTQAAGFRSSAFPQAVVNPANGDLYVTYDDIGTAPGDKADVYFRESTDGGATWSAAVTVNDDGGHNDQWQPALAVNPSGNKVGVFWYDRRNDPANNLIDRYGAIGDVVGDAIVFAPNIRVSDTNFPPEFGRDPIVVGTYMGDYDTVAATTNSFVLTWGDNRLPSHGHAGNNADVRFASVPLSVAGPSVIALAPRGNTLAPVSSVRVRFDEEIDPTSFSADQVASFTDPNGNPVAVTGITPVAGSNNRQFDLTFAAQTVGGTYSLVLGPNIRDTSGNAMDQNHNGVPGEPGIAPAGDQFQGQFTIVGPMVSSTTLTGRLADQVGDGEVDFNTPIDPNSFTPAQFVLTGPAGLVNVTGITALDGTNTRFDVTFDLQTVLGLYHLSIGPNITDTFGNPMAAPYSGTFTLSSERIINGGFETGDFSGWTLSGNTAFTSVNSNNVHSGQFAAEFGPVGSEGFITQTFPTTPGGTYTLSYWLANAGGPANEFEAYINGTILPGSQILNAQPFPYTQYQFVFQATGSQTELKFGYQQDPSFLYLDDVSVSPGSLILPRVVSSSPTGNNNLPGTIDHVRFVFNEPMDPNTFTPDQVSFTDPNGNPIAISAITPVAGTNDVQYDVSFNAVTLAGAYAMVIGPNIADFNGNQLGQTYTAQFGVLAPSVVSTTLTGLLSPPVDHGRVVFNEPMNPSTFTPGQFVLQDPNGNTVNVTSIVPVDGTNTQFDVTFDAQSSIGNYTLTVGPNILDAYGNPMAAPFVSHFNLSNELIVNGSFEMGFTGWTPGTGWIITTPGHTGTNCAGSGAVGSTTPLSQVITTVVGQQYTFSFWYARVDGTPAEIHAFFGGVDVYDEVNTPSHGYELHSFTVTATSTSTTILFMGRNDPSYDDLDDVSVSPNGPAPAPHGGSGGHGGLGGAVPTAAAGSAGSGLLQAAPLAPVGSGGDTQPAWEAARAGAVAQVFASLGAKDGAAALPQRGDAGSLAADPLGFDGLGDGTWLR
jgi:hypothetical protein